MAHVRAFEKTDIPLIVPRLRKADVEEWEAYSGVHPKCLLPFLAYDPNTKVIVRDDGVLVGIFGVGPVKDNPLIGIVWMIATPELETMSIEFLRKCRKEIEKLNELYPVLMNYVDCRNTVHHKWLNWCGFKFISRKERWGAQSLPFYEIVRIKSQCA